MEMFATLFSALQLLIVAYYVIKASMLKSDTFRDDVKEIKYILWAVLFMLSFMAGTGR